MEIDEDAIGFLGWIDPRPERPHLAWRNRLATGACFACAALVGIGLGAALHCL
jgi:hypothetical protein